jgi:macrodomain Ter protein organizer (MatP/YcbG family)
MSIELFTGTGKQYYEEKYLKGSSQIYNTLFPTSDESNGSEFELDKKISNPYAVTYRYFDTQGHQRGYQGGTKTSILVPTATEISNITERLRNSSVSGVNSEADFALHEMKIMADMIDEHMSSHIMTKNKQALDVMFSGVFNANGVNGSDLGLNVDFARDSLLDLTYDFTAAGASFSGAVNNAVEELRGFRAPMYGNDSFVICGSKWLQEYSNDSAIANAAQNNTVNQTATANMTPSLLNNVEGLYIVGQVRNPGSIAPIWVLGYSPTIPYRTEDGTEAPFVADDAAIFGSFADTRYNVKRGMDVLDDNMRPIRATGDVVMDAFNEVNPVSTSLRSQTRHLFAPGNINHTAGSTGTFA